MADLQKYDPDQPRDERGQWADGGESAKVLERLASIPKVPEGYGGFSNGPEIRTIDLWPGAAGQMMIIGHTKPKGVWESVGSVDPSKVIPSQVSVTVSGVEAFVKDPQRVPMGNDKDFPRVAIRDGKAHVVTGTHRLAAALLRGEKSVPVIQTFFESGLRGSVQVRPPKTSAASIVKAFDPLFRPPEYVRKAGKRTAQNELHAALKRLEPRVAAAFAAAVRRVRDKVSLAAISKAITDGDLERAIDLAGSAALAAQLGGDGLEPGRRSARDELLAAFQAGGDAGLRQLPPAAALAASLDLTNPEAVRFLREQVPGLIREVSASAREAVREALHRGVTEGRPIPRIARDIREVVGLTVKQGRAVGNFRRQLESGQLGSGTPPGERRLSATERQVARSIFAAGGETSGRVDALVERYHDSLVNRRANDIARTEVHRAFLSGQEELWKQAADRGLVDPALTRRVWIVTPDDRLRDSHAAIPGMNPDGVGLTEPFETPFGFVMDPSDPVEELINCRCTVALEFRDAWSTTKRDEPIRKYDEDQPRDERGQWSETGAGGGGSRFEHVGHGNYVATNYRGIGKIIGSRHGAEHAVEMKALLDRVLDKDEFGYARGLKVIDLDSGGFLGSVYIPPNQGPGYVEDELYIAPSRFGSNPDAVLLHELGHRGQLVTDTATYREFKTAGLGQYFGQVDDGLHNKVKLTAEQKAGETFAESYSKFVLGLPLPDAVQSFWEKRKINVQKTYDPDQPRDKGGQWSETGVGNSTTTPEGEGTYSHDQPVVRTGKDHRGKLITYNDNSRSWKTPEEAADGVAGRHQTKLVNDAGSDSAFVGTAKIVDRSITGMREKFPGIIMTGRGKTFDLRGGIVVASAARMTSVHGDQGEGGV